MDIIEKLRSPFPTLTGLAKDGMEAADEIDRLHARDKWHQQRIAELERENAELKQLWFSDADPRETLCAAEYAAFAKIKEAL